ncbi:MAG TPA: polysaccharide deacetylase family protein [Ferruginibacter sp.]|nr:polysaccharide deacetylase family protein [Ferruginibacter sp.]
MFYFVKTPKWVRKLYGTGIWEMASSPAAIYLTFDDGPHPVVTPFVLDELKKYGAKASFFCVGRNVQEYPAIYKRIIDEGHAVGNHTYNHLDGWKTHPAAYVADIEKAGEYIDSDLFRPPYGRITRTQQKNIAASRPSFKIIMWTVLSGDFDTQLSPEGCYKNVIENSKSGSVVVFHDSEKAKERMCYSLPLVLKHFTEKGFLFEKIVAGTGNI